MTIKILKLTTGEELIGTVVSEDNYAYRIKNPTIIQLQQHPSGKGQFGIGFIPFMAYCDEDIMIKTDAICALGVPSKALESEFIRATSGIEIATAMPPIFTPPPSTPRKK